MIQLHRDRVRNQLLAGLSAEDFARLGPHLVLVTLELRYTMLETERPIDERVYFMGIGISSILASTSEGRIEVGMIGPEGMTGVSAVLGIDRTPHTFIARRRPRSCASAPRTCAGSRGNARRCR